MIYISEVLPNPAGKDAEGEWIKIANDGDNAVSLSGWSIKDASGKAYEFKSLSAEKNTLPPGGEIVLPFSETRISLNNDGDTIYLVGSLGETVDELGYQGPVSDDEIVGRFPPEEVGVVPAGANIGEAVQTTFSAPVNATPFFTAIFLSIVAGILVWYMAKRIIKKRGEYEKI